MTQEEAIGEVIKTVDAVTESMTAPEYEAFLRETIDLFEERLRAEQVLNSMDRDAVSKGEAAT